MSLLSWSRLICTIFLVCYSGNRLSHARDFIDGHRTGFIMGGGVGAGFGNGLQIPFNFKIGGGLSERSLLYGELWSSFDSGVFTTKTTMLNIQPGIGATFYPQPHQGLHFFSQLGPSFILDNKNQFRLTATTVGVVLGLGWDIIPHVAISVGTRLVAQARPQFEYFAMLQGMVY